MRTPANLTREVIRSKSVVGKSRGIYFLWTNILSPRWTLPLGIVAWGVRDGNVVEGISALRADYFQLDIYIRVWWTRNIEISYWGEK